MSGYSTPHAAYGPSPADAAALAQLKRDDRKRLLWSLLITAVILLLLLWRLGIASHPIASASDAAVEEFHQKLNNEQYHEIYSQADRVFRDSANEEQYTEFLRGIRVYLGKTETSRRQSVRIYRNREGSFALLTYQTKFEHGTRTESFTWKLDGERLVLAGYNINSGERRRRR
jgi:hypothetical protein